ncbi:helix-turn-helix domain-containing protein [Porticoccaceae bacterium]|mgnify:FL=1|jgi:transcriptional regulator with XRE-family HTH domain|nr:helix-turn-helix domain-containing protein [Porticoccaceae bacterium]MDG1200292.1 helix-turn-helix transcriptional regulator [Porticoccaceae bacterium]
MNVIGPKVKALRASKRMTQEALAARCNIKKWDISRSTLAKIEAQVRRVKDEEVALLAQALNVDIKDLYEHTDDISQDQTSSRNSRS